MTERHPFCAQPGCSLDRHHSGPHGNTAQAIRNARHAIGMVDNPRLESVREQLSQILFGDEDHSTAQCLAELRRREEFDRLRDDWLASDPATRDLTRKVRDGRHTISLGGLSRYDGEGADYHAALETSFQTLHAEPHKICLCDSCKEAKECSFIERTGQASGWLCAECDEQILRDRGEEAESDRRNLR